MDNLRVSTMTVLSSINTDIDLDNLFKNININDTISFIEHGSLGIKGESKKLKRKSRKPKKKTFFNQVTLHINCEKIVNVKLFNNGKIQMTGTKYEGHGEKVINLLIPQLLRINEHYQNKILSNDKLEYSPVKIVCINSDFDIGYMIERSILHRYIVDSGMYSSYEPCIYPGVNIKYFFNINQNNGICKCNGICNGKGEGYLDGGCKKVTIAVFKSGKIIITGGRSTKQLETSYNYITKFINDRRDKIELK